MTTPRLLSVCCVFPTPEEPGRGIFVRSRLLALGQLLPLRVATPVGIVRWGAGGRRRFGGSHPEQRDDTGIAIHYPRWFYPPGAGWINGVCLFLRLLPFAVRLRRRYAWNILDAHFGLPEGVAVALLSLLFRCPFTITLRGKELDEARSGVRRTLLGWALRRSSRVFAVSHELRELALTLGVAPAKAIVSPNGVDRTRFHLGDRSKARARLQLDPHTAIVLAAGNLAPVKGFDDLLDAARHLLPAVPHLLLLIAGDAGIGARVYASEFRRRCARPEFSTTVRLLGAIPQETLTDWMHAADLFCLSSRREGFPNVVAEALACGLPVVATKVGAVPELIHPGIHGLTVPARDPKALATALQQALSTEWDRAAIAAWGQLRSWQHVAKELQAEFEQVLAENAPRGKDAPWTSQ